MIAPARHVACTGPSLALALGSYLGISDPWRIWAKWSPLSSVFCSARTLMEFPRLWSQQKYLSHTSFGGIICLSFVWKATKRALPGCKWVCVRAWKHFTSAIQKSCSAPRQQHGTWKSYLFLERTVANGFQPAHSKVQPETPDLVLTPVD